MNKIILLAVILLLQAGLLLAIFDDYQPSARARAMGNAYTPFSDDANAAFYNPAGLDNAAYSAIVGVSQLNGQKFTELKTLAVSAPLPAHLGGIAAGMQALDVDFEDTSLLSEQQFTLAHGFSLLQDIHSAISVGWSANVYHLSMDGYDSDTAFGVNVGGMAVLHERTTFGFAVNNLNQPTVGITNKHNLPRKLAMGIAYKPYDNVTTSIEMKKDFAQDTEFMAGTEIRLFDPLYIRAGVHMNPATWSAGASFRLAGITLDYSYTQHAVLDATHYLNVGYQFKR